jgi:hypothetical protein
MVNLSALWLPILLAAVFVFIASSIIHMLLPYHRNNYRKLAEEDKVRAAIRGICADARIVFRAYCTHKELTSPETKAKYAEGPVLLMTVYPNGPIKMGKFLGMWFAYCVVVSFFYGVPGGAYRGVWRALPRGVSRGRYRGVHGV